jgi:proline iminopeptidase
VVRDRLLETFGGYFRVRPDKWRVVWDALTDVPETDIRDLYRLWRGTEFSQRALWPAFARLDLTTEVPALQMPVTFILGRYDQRTWSPYAAAYLEHMQAPEKRLVWLENAAHNAPFEEPEAFRAAVIAAVVTAPRRADDVSGTPSPP